jgi:putative membrane protein
MIKIRHMTNESNIVKADFNPKIRTYLLLVIALFMSISVVGIPIALIWFLGLGQYYCRRYYENLVCTLTETTLEFKKGVLFKVEKTIPLENIQDLTFIENPILKLFDLRILKIETAGHSNAQGSDMKLIGIIEPREFRSKVLTQRERIKTKTITAPTTSTLNDEKFLNELAEIKSILKEIRDK